VLTLTGVSVGYGSVRVVRDVSLVIEAGTVAALLGPNGAGKTTVLRAISGLLRPTGGSIQFDGAHLDGVRPDVIVRRGIAHVPQGREVFPDMTVQEHLEMGAFTRRDRAGTLQDMAAVFADFPILAERRRQRAGTLSGGEQQMLAIGRALMARPRMLLMDEPSLGLAPVIVHEVFRIIRRLNRGGLTILLAEQNVNMALAVASTGHVLESGQIVLSGNRDTLRSNERVTDAYLGEAARSR
jgi:branched-chain amino acid transport system ATP-binding protein